MDERTITIEGKVYTSMRRSGDFSCDGCHLRRNIHAPCGVQPDCGDMHCEDDEIWILKEKKDMKQKIEVGMWVRIDSEMGDSYSGNGKVGRVVGLLWEHTAEVDVNGEMFKPCRDSCIPLKQYTTSDTFTIDALLEAESCRDSHFKEDFETLLKQADDIFSPIKELPAHFYECDTMRDKLIGFGFVEEVKKKERTYKIGDRLIFNATGVEYIIAYPEIGKCCLINMDRGTRISDPVNVGSVHAITQKELDIICCGSGRFTLKEDYGKEPF